MIGAGRAVRGLAAEADEAGFTGLDGPDGDGSGADADAARDAPFGWPFGWPCVWEAACCLRLRDAFERRLDDFFTRPFPQPPATGPITQH